MNLSADSRAAEEGNPSPIKDFKPDTNVPEERKDNQLQIKLCAVEEEEDSIEPASASEDKSP